IKAFFGTSPNAVQTQVWIAVTVYLLIAILRKRLGLAAPLSELLHILSATLYEQTGLECALQQAELHQSDTLASNQLILFDD
ncbi:MAG: IS4 family transposase, partial [Rhodanobacteraceae bacterium]